MRHCFVTLINALNPTMFLFCLQKVSEKVGGAEGTKLDVDFTEMEKARLNFFCFHLKNEN